MPALAVRHARRRGGSNIFRPGWTAGISAARKMRGPAAQRPRAPKSARAAFRSAVEESLCLRLEQDRETDATGQQQVVNDPRGLRIVVAELADRGDDFAQRDDLSMQGGLVGELHHGRAPPAT